MQSVVAIGLSADGLGAIRTLLEGRPAGLDAPVIVVMHRAPQPVPRLAPVIARRCALPVKEATPMDVLVPGHVYLAPPDVHLVVADGHLQLRQTERVSFSRPSIDVLFDSVAKAYGPRAVGVILSGAGKDGARGLQAIRAAGGTTIVQDPHEARYGRLPKAASKPTASTSRCRWRTSAKRSSRSCHDVATRRQSRASSTSSRPADHTASVLPTVPKDDRGSEATAR